MALVYIFGLVYIKFVLFFLSDLYHNAAAHSVLSDFSNWQKLGQELGIDSEKLEQSDKYPTQYSEKVIGLWVEKDQSASWEKLSQALDRMGEHDLSKKIRDTCNPLPQVLAQHLLEPGKQGMKIV